MDGQCREINSKHERCFNYRFCFRQFILLFIITIYRENRANLHISTFMTKENIPKMYGYLHYTQKEC